MHRDMYNEFFCGLCCERFCSCTPALLKCQLFTGCCSSEAVCAPSYIFDKLLCSQAGECVLASAAAAMAPMPNKYLLKDSNKQFVIYNLYIPHIHI